MTKSVCINKAAHDAIIRSTESNVVGATFLANGTIQIDLDDDVLAAIERFKDQTGDEVQDVSAAILLACSGNFGHS